MEFDSGEEEALRDEALRDEALRLLSPMEISDDEAPGDVDSDAANESPADSVIGDVPEEVLGEVCEVGEMPAERPPPRRVTATRRAKPMKKSAKSTARTASKASKASKVTKRRPPPTKHHQETPPPPLAQSPHLPASPPDTQTSQISKKEAEKEAAKQQLERDKEEFEFELIHRAEFDGVTLCEDSGVRTFSEVSYIDVYNFAGAESLAYSDEKGYQVYAIRKEAVILCSSTNKSAKETRSMKLLNRKSWDALKRLVWHLAFFHKKKLITITITSIFSRHRTGPIISQPEAVSMVEDTVTPSTLKALAKKSRVATIIDPLQQDTKQQTAKRLLETFRY